jgi:hypothetical protein
MPVQGLARDGGLHERSHLSHRAHRGDHGGSITPWPALTAPENKEGGSWPPVRVLRRSQASIQWSAIIAGAIGAAALAFVLHTFAGAIGLSISSAAPTWRDASWALVLLSGLYLVLMALASYGFGAYLAARLRTPAAGGPEGVEFSDGMHGLIVWALATLLTGLIAVAAIQAVPRLAAPRGHPAGLRHLSRARTLSRTTLIACFAASDGLRGSMPISAILAPRPPAFF